MNANIDPQNPADPGARSRAPLVLTAVVGGVLLVGALGAATIAGVSALNRGGSDSQRLTAATAGIAELDIEIGAADFTLVYDATGADEAVLDVGEGPREWRLDRAGDRLEVRAQRGWFFGDWIFFGSNTSQTVTLHLPESLREQRLDADFSLGAGDFRADGDFGEVEAEVAAGTMRLTGGARSLSFDVSAGDGYADLADVDDAELSVSAGSISAVLTGTAPRNVEIEVSAGGAEIVLPDRSYAVSTARSAGSIDNRLRTDPSSRSTVKAETSAGDIILRPGS